MAGRLPTEQRRIQIADAALAVIARDGLAHFTTQAIAAEVGVTDGTLFRHFDSKVDIVLAALDRVEHELFDGIPESEPDPRARLEGFFRHRAELIVRKPIIARLAFSEALPDAAGPAGAAQVARWKARSHALIVGCLTEMSPGRDPQEVRHLTLVWMGALLALARVGPHDAQPTDVDGLWRVLCTLIPEESP